MEGQNFDIRKRLLEYDDVLREQREIMYDQRNEVLENDDVHGMVKDMFSRVLSNLVSFHRTENGTVDFDGLNETLMKQGFKGKSVDPNQFNGLSVENMTKALVDQFFDEYDQKIDPYKEQILPIEKRMVLRVVDSAWMEHIDQMDRLRNGIHLRSYAQSDPLKAYVEEGYEMFEDMLQRIARDVVMFCLNVQVQVQE